jgi:hypothetical protein
MFVAIECPAPAWLRQRPRLIDLPFDGRDERQLRLGDVGAVGHPAQPE